LAHRSTLWATSYTGLHQRRVGHKTKAAVDEWVEQEAREWAAGNRAFRLVTVYADERDGKGFQPFKVCDLAVLVESLRE
jgi:hypothetical protein